MTAHRSLLVTGGAGFIGANFVHYWHRHHPADRLVVLDALTYAGNRRNLQAVEEAGGVRFVHGSVCDGALVGRLLAEHGIDTIVHFAAESHVDRSISGPDPFIETNIVGTHTLLKQARLAWLENGDKASTSASGGGGESGSRASERASSKRYRFHHVSTDEVFGSLAAAAPPSTEAAPYAPNSPYAASKAAADHLVRAYHCTYGLDVTASHCSNNYGPYQFPEKLLPLCLLNILRGEPLPLYGDGQHIRDWLHVDDHSRALDHVLHKGEPGETYNIGGNNQQTNIDTIRLLCTTVDRRFKADPTLRRRFPAAPYAAEEGRKGKESNAKSAAGGTEEGGEGGAARLIRFVPDRPGHDRRYAVDGSKIAKHLGFRPAIDFTTGLEQMVDWYLSNEAWWRAVIDGSYRQ